MQTNQLSCTRKRTRNGRTCIHGVFFKKRSPETKKCFFRNSIFDIYFFIHHRLFWPRQDWDDDVVFLMPILFMFSMATVTSLFSQRSSCFLAIIVTTLYRPSLRHLVWQCILFVPCAKVVVIILPSMSFNFICPFSKHDIIICSLFGPAQRLMGRISDSILKG